MARARALARLWRSTAARLSLRFAALYAVITAIVLGLSYHYAGRELDEWVSAQLAGDAAGFAALYDSAGLGAVQARLAGLGGFNYEDYRLYLLQDGAGRVLAGNVDAIAWQGGAGYVSVDAITPPPRAGDVRGYLVHRVALGPNRLTLGTSTYFLEELREVLGRGFVAGFVLLMLVGALAGLVVGGRTERRLAQISAALGAVAAGRLDRRVPAVAGDTDDLARVAREMNRTLARLAQLVDSQKQISADIAHDLRTPMQRLRQRLERLRMAPDLSAVARDEADQAIAIADELIETFHALLRIAQIESHSPAAGLAPTPLAPILARISDAYGAVAEDKDQRLVCDIADPGATVAGDQHLLTQMIANLVENALHHCPPGARIAVTLAGADGGTGGGGDGVVITVADDGPGIPLAERDRVFRRFYRLEKSRTTPGNGLGLAMVRAIAERHGATVTLGDNHPGLRVTITLPRAAQPAANSPISTTI